MKSAKECMHLVVYAVYVYFEGESSKNHMGKRKRIFKNLKRKISMAIPSSSDSVKLAIKRACKHVHGHVAAINPLKTLVQKNLAGN